jgi:conjugative transfer region lipoprotein (TIGR03751 family)
MAWIDSPAFASGFTRALGIAGCIALAGCAAMGAPHSSPLPTTGPTMEEIYRNHSDHAAASGSAADEARARLPLRAAADYNPGPAHESALSQIERRFARVQNPDLLMTVFPHLAKGRYPVPGYVTSFPMYESVEYLLPGEAAGNEDGLR